VPLKFVRRLLERVPLLSPELGLVVNLGWSFPRLLTLPSLLGLLTLPRPLQPSSISYCKTFAAIEHVVSERITACRRIAPRRLRRRNTYEVEVSAYATKTNRKNSIWRRDCIRPCCVRPVVSRVGACQWKSSAGWGRRLGLREIRSLDNMSQEELAAVKKYLEER
jgi:hypothetical protein